MADRIDAFLRFVLGGADSPVWWSASRVLLLLAGWVVLAAVRRTPYRLILIGTAGTTFLVSLRLIADVGRGGAEGDLTVYIALFNLFTVVHLIGVSSAFGIARRRRAPDRGYSPGVELPEPHEQEAWMDVRGSERPTASVGTKVMAALGVGLLALGALALLGARHPPGELTPIGNFEGSRQERPSALEDSTADLVGAVQEISVPAEAGPATQHEVVARLWRLGFRWPAQSGGVTVLSGSCGQLAFVATESNGRRWFIALGFGQRPGGQWQTGACAAPQE